MKYYTVQASGDDGRTSDCDSDSDRVKKKRRTVSSMCSVRVS